MNNREIIERYKTIASFLHKCLGRNVEIVVHDVSDPGSSVVAIHNNDISGRGIGAPLTDFALNTINKETYRDKPYIVNYSGESRDGRMLRSSTFFIKNDKRKLIGLLCLNIDVSKYRLLLEELDSLFKCGVPAGMPTPAEPGAGRDEPDYHEIFPSSVSNMIDIIVKKKVGNIPVERLIPNEKAAIVEELDNQGVFLLKGSILAVAEMLHISEATTYRYLGKTRKRKAANGNGEPSGPTHLNFHSGDA